MCGSYHAYGLANLSSNGFVSFSHILLVYFETITENVPQPVLLRLRYIIHDLRIRWVAT